MLSGYRMLVIDEVEESLLRDGSISDAQHVGGESLETGLEQLGIFRKVVAFAQMVGEVILRRFTPAEMVDRDHVINPLRLSQKVSLAQKGCRIKHQSFVVPS